MNKKLKDQNCNLVFFIFFNKLSIFFLLFKNNFLLFLENFFKRNFLKLFF